MPRTRSKNKRKLEPEVAEQPKNEPDIRNYLDPESLSQHLFCSICQEVFVHPQRAPCGHSYCKEVACPNRTYGCSHIGPLSNLGPHVKQCSYDPNNIPEFLKDELKQMPENTDDNEGEDGRSEELPYVSLKMRIFQAGGVQRENLIKIFDKPDNVDAKHRKLYALLDEQ